MDQTNFENLQQESTEKLKPSALIIDVMKAIRVTAKKLADNAESMKSLEEITEPLCNLANGMSCLAEALYRCREF